MAGHSHRSTLKNNHKPFKSRHASKGSLKASYKGKVEKSETGTNKKLKITTKQERKNIAQQLRQNKILQTSLERQLFAGSNGAEKVVTILALADDIDGVDIANLLLVSLNDSTANSQDLKITDQPSINSFRIERFKSNIKFVLPDMSNFLSVLDACKVSDFIVLGLSATEEVSPEFGEQIIRAIELQGIASVLPVVSNLVTAYPKKNFQQDVLRSLNSYIKHFFPTQDKVFNLEAVTESLNAMRTLCQKFPKSITWRDSRGYLLANRLDYHNGSLVVEGTVRGVGFNSNRLVHLPGLGDFQLDHIEVLPKPGRKQTEDQEMSEQQNFYPSPESQENLEEISPEDPNLEDEDMQDVVSEEEKGPELGVRLDGYEYFEDARDKDSVPVNMPKSLSEFQSRWYLNDQLDEITEVDEQLSSDEVEGEQQMEVDIDIDEVDQEQFEELDAEEEARQLQTYKERERQDLEFPDEFELLPNVSAKKTLERYRGVKSLANCDWDYDEKDDLKPEDWHRLLRISNFTATKNRILKEAINEAEVRAGTLVRLYINAPEDVVSKIPNVETNTFTIYALLEHEHKLAVSNFSIQAWEEYDKPIPSKDTMIVQYGFRRQVIEPVFSAASNNSNNVHKYERFLHKESVAVATAIAPVMFPSTPAIFFKEGPEGQIELLGQGTFLNCDHSRVLAKRIVLTGEPFKMHKRLVTVRYMFFNPEDINWFKAIPLFTKMGRAGIIKESLGTHGYFKATFDGKLNAQDTIAMALYKRMWPKRSTLASI
ncbi:Ribosome biogenesis protein TSR1 (20S rRNA accumulation protein 1) [Komagataella phaffii CBS 7435]|uniref:Protein required for processing of 20S pre-rRNA in the cytoplasm n=2 Tax=Komagataella phaffii TaxID=460519 RepID=C4QYN5_KOMPG|nr:Protein required for processing of 20S pre-rRNA in the cytoplasm [Komagataella phaffii GS115]AOA60774.1 GQ67_01645T0 [Komagataella phaffii]CAH2447184.1 Ribosome biogenesis protein TSR1 (20S rRNA accumulation protein 1) [Komagataella phaffii CBS 7435]AOA65720.1 GQ68_01661T0 [Komagataella phaffii GS115]CAY68359.1 Protein required for processing of 20S pre-rRNA in the cytoplasm [Komagataella phaffii GS115]CCA37427.2 Ribosome biogenesis protein TSR1 (20S rRNA accumulation protein 1) [Komagatael